MKAEQLTKEHLGQYVRHDHGEGVLRYIDNEKYFTVRLILQQEDKSFIGLNLSFSEKVSVERLLKDQVKDDLSSLSTHVIDWLKSSFR